MKRITNNGIIKWLLDGDISIRYQTYRDLIGIEKPGLRRKISSEGWGSRFLSLRNQNGHWAKGFYQPKWTSTHYTLLDLRNLSIVPDNGKIKETIDIIIKNNKCQDGGITTSRTFNKSDVCLNGMFLNYAAYFNTDEEDLKSIVDFLLTQKMKDGGFNCHSNSKGAVHSSLHTTLSVAEGINEYEKNGYRYRLNELQKVELTSREFMLTHKFYKSHRTGKLIKNQFITLSYPPRWYFDILRALDYFYHAKAGYDDRMRDAFEVLLKKRSKDGRWKLQAHHPGQIHFDMEKVGVASRWNTLRSLRVLNFYGISL